MNAYRQAISTYKNIELESKVLNASPHELINLLFQGAIGQINSAKTSITHQQIAQRGHHIGKAISIVGGLRSSLDMEQGQDIADNLDRVYEYIQNTLLQANLRNDMALLNETHHLLNELFTAWRTIGLTAKD